MPTPFNLAHRGFSGKYPENTMLAFERAVTEGGCHGFETDVHLTADNEPVILHDCRLERTTDGSGLVGQSTWRELQKLDAGRWLGKEFAGQRIPHLRQVLELAGRHGLWVNLELKNAEQQYPGLEALVVALVCRMGLEHRVILSSFHHGSMACCNRLSPTLPAGLLYLQPLYFADEYAQRAGASALHPHYQVLEKEPELVKRCHKKGLRVHTWTVNEPEDMRRMLALGVDSIITNYPDRLSGLLEKGGEQ